MNPFKSFPRVEDELEEWCQNLSDPSKEYTEAREVLGPAHIGVFREIYDHEAQS